MTDPIVPADRAEIQKAVEGLATVWSFALRKNRLAVLALVAEVTDASIREQVQYDRDSGSTWGSIADDLGVTRQAATQRFGGGDRAS